MSKLRTFYKLIQLEDYIWASLSGILLGFVITSSFHLSNAVHYTLAILLVQASVFTFGSIEDAPLDALGEGKKPDNPIATGEVSVRTGWIISGVLNLMGIVLASLTFNYSILPIIGINAMGVFYFYHRIRPRHNRFLDRLGFTLISTFFPFVGAVDPSLQHDLSILVVPLLLILCLTYGIYLSKPIFTGALPFYSDSVSRKRLSLLLLTIITNLSGIYVFLLTHLVDHWTTVLMMALFGLMILPNIKNIGALHEDSSYHIVASTFRKAMVISFFVLILSLEVWGLFNF